MNGNMTGNKKNEKGANEEFAKSQKPKRVCPPARNISHPLRYYEFTQEEIKTLEECDRDSFYQRCLPLSTLFATITYAGIKSGYMRRSPHFGVIPKVALAIALGYACGRVSYIPLCEKKLRKLPSNSYLGNVMRQYHAENNPKQPAKA